MRLLFVASRFPWPLTHGDSLRAYHQLRLLSQRHRIVLLAPQPAADVEENLSAIRPFCAKVETVATPLWRRLARLGQAPFTSLPLQTLYAFDPQMRRQAERLLHEETFDLIHVQLMRMAPVADSIRDVPTLIDFIDALSLNMKRRTAREAWYRAWLFSLETRRAQAYEQQLLLRYDQAVVSTKQDHEALGSHNRIHVAANGVDPDRTFVEEGRKPNVIAFTGHISYFPNADAAIWFVSQVLPLVRRQIPDAQFWIIGADPPPAVQALTQQEGVIVTGRVPSITHHLQQATLAVAPMQCGSGMQLKVLEAMACGAPIVVTPFTLGGLDVRHDEHLLIGHDATEFAELVTQLLQDRALGRRLAINARRLVDEKYTWEQSVAQLEHVYAQAIRHHRNGCSCQVAQVANLRYEDR
jgi:sugar transferase (PEP-CTERM/EpsH1 system associated)